MIRAESIPSAPPPNRTNVMAKPDLSRHLTVFGKPAFDYATLDANLADQARHAAERIRSHERAAAVEIGRELIAVKDALPHGQFIPWIEAEFGYSRRTATNLMQVAAEFGEQAKWETVSHLPTAVLYKLAAPSTPNAVRETVLNLGSDKRVDPASVKRLIVETRVQEIRKERRVRAKNGPSPEEQAKALQRERREARENAKRAAEQEADRQAAQKAAQIVKDALGNQLAALQALFPEERYHSFRSEFLAALLEPVTADQQAAA